MRRASFAPSHVVVEVVEHALAWNPRDYAQAVDELRDLGVSIALDDIGVGLSNYRMMLDTRPNYLKIDRYVVTGCDADPRRSAILESIWSLAERLGAMVIAEGVETAAELAQVQAVGIRLVQGFLLSKPKKATAFAGEALPV